MQGQQPCHGNGNHLKGSDELEKSMPIVGMAEDPLLAFEADICIRDGMPPYVRSFRR